MALVLSVTALTACSDTSGQSSVSSDTAVSQTSETTTIDKATEPHNENKTVPFEKEGMLFSAVSGFYDKEF